MTDQTKIISNNIKAHYLTKLLDSYKKTKTKFSPCFTRFCSNIPWVKCFSKVRTFADRLINANVVFVEYFVARANTARYTLMVRAVVKILLVTTGLTTCYTTFSVDLTSWTLYSCRKNINKWNVFITIHYKIIKIFLKKIVTRFPKLLSTSRPKVSLRLKDFPIEVTFTRWNSSPGNPLC